MIRGLPFAFGVVAAQTILFGPLESSKQGPASSIYNTLRQVAASFGVALIITIAISRTHVHGGTGRRRRSWGITTPSSSCSCSC